MQPEHAIVNQFLRF